MNITTSKAEFFSIRCGINQAVQIPNTEYIIIITDIIPTARHIFNLSFHPFQFLKILEHSSTRTLTTLLIFGTVLAVTNCYKLKSLELDK